MDGLFQNFSVVPRKYLLAPLDGQSVKMDAIKVIILPIPASYNQAKDDIIGKFAAFAYDHLKNNGQVHTPPS